MDVPVWMRDSPFTKEEVEAYNRYTHFPSKINEEFDRQIHSKEKKIRDELAEYGVHELTEALETALNYYRKAVYNYYLEESRARSIAPPMSVVGPSKYPVHRIPQAEKISRKALSQIELAEKYIDRGVSAAIKGKPAVAIIQKWLPLVKAAKNRLAFGKQYLDEMKKELRAKPESEMTGHDHLLLSGTMFDHVLRAQGRAIYDKLTPLLEEQEFNPKPTETDEGHFLDMMSAYQKALVEGWKNKGYTFWSWGKPSFELSWYEEDMAKKGYDPKDYHTITVRDLIGHEWRVFYVRPKKAKLPTWQETLAGEAALLAQRVRAPEKKKSKPVEMKYVEPPPLQKQLFRKGVQIRIDNPDIKNPEVMSKELQLQRLKAIFRRYNPDVDISVIDFEAYFDPSLSLTHNLTIIANTYREYQWVEVEYLSEEAVKLKEALDELQEIKRELSVARKSARLSEVERLKEELSLKERELRETEASVESRVQRRLREVEAGKLSAEERVKVEKKEVESVLLFENDELLRFYDEAVSGVVPIRRGALNLIRGELERRRGKLYNRTYLLPLRWYEGFDVSADYFFHRHPDIGIFRCKPHEKCIPITREYVLRTLRAGAKLPEIKPTLPSEIKPALPPTPAAREVVRKLERVRPTVEIEAYPEERVCEVCGVHFTVMNVPLEEKFIHMARRLPNLILTDLVHIPIMCKECQRKDYGRDLTGLVCEGAVHGYIKSADVVGVGLTVPAFIELCRREGFILTSSRLY